MHGRRKAEHAGRSEAEKAAQQAKVAKYQQLAALALARRRQEGPKPADLAASLQLSGQLLRVNPDVYTLWNHRKEVIQGAGLLLAASTPTQADTAPSPPAEKEKVEEEGQIQGPSTTAAAAATDPAPAPGTSATPTTTSSSSDPNPRAVAREFLDGELALVAECIQKNSKSYGAWHHRRWLLEQTAAPAAGLGGGEGLASLLEKELALCGKLLDADERNFHCWNYRRFVAGLHPTRTASDEFAFSTEKIYRNFSNYSAFHHRATYAPGYLREAGLDARDFVRQELEMVQQAVFTEPDDQTAWWYHQYLVALAAQISAEQDDVALFLKEVLRGEAAAIRGLLEESSDYRWAVLTLAALLRRLAGVLVPVLGEENGGGAEPEGKAEAEAEAEALLAESKELYERLARLDPDHARRYQSQLAAPLPRPGGGFSFSS